MIFSEISKDTLISAAELLAKTDSWESVYDKYPQFETPHRAYCTGLHSRGKAGTPSFNTLPASDLEKLGRQLNGSIGGLAGRYRNHQQEEKKAKNNGHRSISAPISMFESRSLSSLYEECAKSKGVIPDDETVAILSFRTLDAIKRCRTELSDRWEFAQNQDGSWSAAEKIKDLTEEEYKTLRALMDKLERLRSRK